MRELVTGLALATLTIAPCGATASLTCDAADRGLSFELLGNVGRGDGATIQLIGGTLTLNAVRGKFDAIEFNVGPANIAGQWSFGDELRIGIAPEAVKDVSVFLAIIARRTKSADGDMDRYRGHYVAKVSGPKAESIIRGRLKGCAAG